MQFQITSRRENRQTDTCVIKIRVLRKVFFANNFAFTDAEDSISEPLNRGGIVDEWCNLTLTRWIWATKVYLRARKISKICLFGCLSGRATS